MKTNEAAWDRIIRIGAGFVLGYLGLGGVIGGTLGIIATILGAVLLVTGAIGWCPLYSLAKFSTLKA